MYEQPNAERIQSSQRYQKPQYCALRHSFEQNLRAQKKSNLVDDIHLDSKFCQTDPGHVNRLQISYHRQILPGEFLHRLAIS